MTPGVLGKSRTVALALIALLVLAATAAAFAESYRGLYDWAAHHHLTGMWAIVWPLQVDVFIAVGELALFIALTDRWDTRSRGGAWAVTLAGLAVSVAGNVGHVATHDLASRITAAVPPLAAAAALAVGLGVLKRIVAAVAPEPGRVAADKKSAARVALAASVAAGNPVSQRQLMTRFGLSRADEREVRQAVLVSANGHGGAS